jgi:hypothetical protein
VPDRWSYFVHVRIGPLAKAFTGDVCFGNLLARVAGRDSNLLLETPAVRDFPGGEAANGVIEIGGEKVSEMRKLFGAVGGFKELRYIGHVGSIADVC